MAELSKSINSMSIQLKDKFERERDVENTKSELITNLIVGAGTKGNNAVISISNKSQHIDQDKLNKMFEKFYRVDTSKSNKIESSGLGLVISKKIVELYKGKVWVECQGDLITIYVELLASHEIE